MLVLFINVLILDTDFLTMFDLDVTVELSGFVNKNRRRMNYK